MSGTFSGFGTALSALRYNRVVLDNASSNIANSGTEGYTRRRVEAASVGAPAVPAMWSRYDASGDGVAVTGITRMTDSFIDARRRTEHGTQSYLDTRQAVLDRVETGIGEPGTNGISAALEKFRAAWGDLSNSPDGSAQRSAVLASARSLAETINAQGRNVTTEAADQRARINVMVAEANIIAGDLAAVNRSIEVAELHGSEAGTLLDQRDQLALRLTELTGAKAVGGDTGSMTVTLNGVPLVSGAVAGRISVASGVTSTGEADGSPVSFAVTDGSGTTVIPTALSGELGGVEELLDTTLPGYLAGLDAVATTVAEQVNAGQAAGYDLDGAAGAPLFALDASGAALSISVVMTDPDQIAASSAAGTLDGDNADAIAGLKDAGNAYQKLVSGFGSEVASATRLAANQQVLTDQVDAAREQQAGVSLDEEMSQMIIAQRAYEAASRVISTLDSVLDTLINRTGLT